MNYLTTKEIVKEMNQISEKLDRKFQNIHTLELKISVLTEKICLANKEISELHIRLGMLSRNQAAKKEFLK